MSGKNRKILANAVRFIQICMNLLLPPLGNKSYIISKGTQKYLTPDRKSFQISAMLLRDEAFDNSSEKENSFYKWNPPGVKELKFSEMKHFNEYSEYKQKHLLTSPHFDRTNFSNTPPQQKSYIKIKKSKSQINVNTEKTKKSPVPELPNKMKEESQKLIELKKELKIIRQTNHDYLKKNQELEQKFYDLSNAYKVVLDLFDRLYGTSKKVFEEFVKDFNSKKKWNGILENLQEERKKIDNYLKFKSIFSFRFGDLVDDLGKNTYNEYIDMYQSKFPFYFR